MSVHRAGEGPQPLVPGRAVLTLVEGRDPGTKTDLDEAYKWCGAKFDEEYRKQTGLILCRAHHVKHVKDESGRQWHKPACGAAINPHLEGDCFPGPTGWPACRRCAGEVRSRRKRQAMRGLTEYFYEPES